MDTQLKLKSLLNQLNTVIVGKTDAVRDGVACLLAGGHLLIEDAPGVGKTTLAKRLAEHSDRSHWFEEIANVTMEAFPSRQEALDAEKKAIQEDAKKLFEGKRGPKAVDAQSEPERLYSEIGRLKMELDWLKKKSGMSLS